MVIFRGGGQRPVASGCCRLECAEMKVVPTSHPLLQLLHSSRLRGNVGNLLYLIVVTVAAVSLVDYYSNDDEKYDN